MCFRFECGEFLRASEVLTIHGHADMEETEDNGEPIVHPSESFAKLYRNTKDNQLSTISDMQSNHFVKQSHVLLSSYTAPGEFVHVHCNGKLFLEECVFAPKIKREKDHGWEYEVIVDVGIQVRKGPSFVAPITATTLQHGAIVSINEIVIPDGESISWLRLKDGRGFIHSNKENGELLVTRKATRIIANDNSYKLISRLFNAPDHSKN
jgi:hypothetical protein